MIRYDDANYGSINNRAITQIPEQDFNRGLSDAIPDVLQGLRTKALPHRLQHHALHRDRSLALCHFAAQFQRTDGDLRQAMLQAAYYGAILVNARSRALAQARQEGTGAAAAIDEAGEDIAVFTCISNGLSVEVYTHYCEDEQYYQNLVGRASLLEPQGRILIRNIQDLARSKSYQLAALLGAELGGEEEKDEKEVKKDTPRRSRRLQAQQD